MRNELLRFPIKSKLLTCILVGWHRDSFFSLQNMTFLVIVTSQVDDAHLSLLLFGEFRLPFGLTKGPRNITGTITLTDKQKTNVVSYYDGVSIICLYYTSSFQCIRNCVIFLYVPVRFLINIYMYDSDRNVLPMQTYFASWFPIDLV